jgi:hypothetical protein
MMELQATNPRQPYVGAQPPPIFGWWLCLWLFIFEKFFWKVVPEMPFWDLTKFFQMKFQNLER